MNIDVPGVEAIQQSARFFRQDDRDFVEISFVGAKDTLVQKVTPEHMAKFRQEWDHYCDGTPMKQRPGTPLTDLQGVDQQRADSYIARNVHSLEELAVLSDAQCQALGHGTLTLRKAAIDLLSVRKFQASEEARRKVTDAAATIGPRPAEQYASASDLAEVKTQIASLTGSISELVAALAAKKPGRPKKEAQ